MPTPYGFPDGGVRGADRLCALRRVLITALPSDHRRATWPPRRVTAVTAALTAVTRAPDTVPRARGVRGCPAVGRGVAAVPRCPRGQEQDQGQEEGAPERQEPQEPERREPRRPPSGPAKPGRPVPTPAEVFPPRRPPSRPPERSSGAVAG